MFKFVVLSALVAVAFARSSYVSHLDTPLVYASAPAYHQDYVEVHEPTVTKVGEYVESVPSAVSHQSSTVVHSKAHVVTPIFAESIKTSYAPVVNAYQTHHVAPVAHLAPVAHHVAPVAHHVAHHVAPVDYSVSPVAHVASIAHAVPYGYGSLDHASPLSYGYDADQHYHHEY